MIGGQTEISVLLNRLEGELGRIEGMARGVEETIMTLVHDTGAGAHPSCTALQEIDLLVQTAADVKAFLHCLAATSGSQGEICLQDALLATRLERVRKALAGGRIEVPVESEQVTFF